MISLRSMPYALAGAAFALATTALADVPPGPRPEPAPPYQADPPIGNDAPPAPAPDTSAYGPTNGAGAAAYPVDPPDAAGFDWMLWGGLAAVAAVAVVAIVLMRRRRG